MPFETILSPYVNNDSCYTSSSPSLITKEFNGGGGGEIGHPRTEDTANDNTGLEGDDSNPDEETKLEEDQDKFLALSRGFYPERNCGTSISSALPYSTFNAAKLFNPYPGRLQTLSMSPFSHFEEESPRSSKSPAFESSHYINYKEEKLKDLTCEEEQKIFISGEESSDVYMNKPIYPWMVDSRHNTKNRQPPIYEGDKDQFNQFLGGVILHLT